MSIDPVVLAQDLIRRRSVTPQDDGALAVLGDALAGAGFAVEYLTFSEPGTPEVANLYARLGTEGPVLVFAGHTDVVPPGGEADWTHPPFAAEIADGVLYGRGAVDMKGGVAAMAAAALQHIAEHGRPQGSIAFLITGDEEGPAINGTPKLLDWAVARGERFDHCVLGEPSSRNRLGDEIKIGRRGSLSGTVVVHGVQGHVAYPHKADNPIRRLLPLIEALHQPLDEGTAHFERSNLEVTSVDVGNPTVNVIPARALARFNVRFNDAHTLEGLKDLLRHRVARAAGDSRYELDFVPGASASFVTEPGAFVDLVSDAVEAETGQRPVLSTGGGTSDARFIKDHCPVIELGPLNSTMHQTDERIPVAELHAVTRIYRSIIERYFAG
ncbi:succinyl-diaminopimelate desuccinylase [Terrihabitans sp. B22-R8]|uniref:succinyl-diaminopimelate desuccinylase n=1 Tax=Terrihabitans sp. B22-R8 TaxID=3425128 RepID=UPI00403D3A83